MPRRRLRQHAASSSALLSGFLPRSTRPWTERMSGRGAAPGLSRCSSPPDLLNHIHSRRRDLCGGSFATTELLRRSRCCLLLVLVGWQVPWAVCREDRLQSDHNCSCWKIDSSLAVSTSAVTAIQTDHKTGALPQEESQPTIDNDSSRLHSLPDRVNSHARWVHVNFPG